MTTDLAFAHVLADAADAISFRHFQSDTLRVETKARAVLAASEIG